VAEAGVNITNTSMPCNTSLAAIFTNETLTTNQYGAFDNFVNEFCTKNMDFRVPSKLSKPNSYQFPYFSKFLISL